jgi:hypothetical protein
LITVIALFIIIAIAAVVQLNVGRDEERRYPGPGVSPTAP